ncbi:MAG: beta-ketoacyl-ACP synthase II [Gammaproteobacteria bacterium]|nr:beta-ketoacyl-ACP synthase II [Gammaproteobacteria bacterium]MCH9743400.1 beta-ketoacyl-ACP synthase II [Gammaproteobacteria bacterium]
MSNRRVVVTGLGIVSPVGNDVETAWSNILAGKSGVREIDRFDTSELNTKIAGLVDAFDPNKVLSPKEQRRFAVFVQFAAEACRQAMLDAALEVDDELAPRVGVSVGSGIGGLPWIEKSHKALLDGGPRKVSPFFIPGAIVNMAPGLIAMKNNLQGPNISIVTACTTGTHSIGVGARMIQHGDADIMVVGGTEMSTDSLCIGGFSSARALSTRNDAPQKASRPWDKDRDGFVLGEGAGVLILEEYEVAKKRGAKIYAEFKGFGMSDDAYHITSPEPNARGFTLAMKNTLRDAGVSPEDVDYVNAHGTSTPAADHVEALAIKNTFGEHAYKMAVSSTKSMTGHLLGAAGAVEAIFSVLALRDQVAPPTINLDNPGEGCDLDFVPHKARKMDLNYVMSNSFGFGGTNGSLLFSKVETA